MKRLPLALALLVALAASLLLAPTASAAGLSTFTYSKTSVSGGTTISASVRLAAAAPAGGQQVTFTASNSYATAPAPITVAAGRTSAAARFATRPVDRDVSVTLTASAGGVEKSLTVVLTPAKLYSVSTPSLLVAGDAKTGTVNLNAYAVAAVVVSLSSSDDGIASVPASVTVPAGKRSATFLVSTTTASRGTATITASGGGVSTTDTTKVDVAQLYSVGITRTMAADASTTGKVRLTGKAPAGGLTVALSAPAGSPLTFPATVTVPEGVDYQTFPVTAGSPPVATRVVVTGRLAAVTKVASVTVNPPVVSATLAVVVALPEPVGSTSDVVIGVGLFAPVTSGSVSITLTSSNQTALPLSRTVSIPAGNDAHILVARTGTVSVTTPETITATSGGAAVSTQITVKPYVIFDLVPPTAAQVGPRTASATVQLTGPAPAGGALVTLSSSSSLVGVPVSVTVPAGAMVANVPLTIGLASSQTTVTITATAHGTSVSSTVTVNPLGLAGWGSSGTAVTGGTAGRVTANLNGSAPSGGATITLTSSNPDVLSVPATATVASGSTAANVDFSTSPVATATTVRLTASYNGSTITRDITVLPAAPTPEPTAAPTVAVTPEPTVETTPEPTVEATATPEPIATETPAATATPVATATSTVEAPVEEEPAA